MTKKLFAPIFVMWWRFWAFGWYWRPHIQPTFRVLVIGLGPLRIVMNRPQMREKLEAMARPNPYYYDKGTYHG